MCAIFKIAKCNNTHEYLIPCEPYSFKYHQKKTKERQQISKISYVLLIVPTGKMIWGGSDLVCRVREITETVYVNVTLFHVWFMVNSRRTHQP